MANELKWGVDGRVRERIRNLALTTDWTPAQIRREVIRVYGEEGIPGDRAVQKAVKQLRGSVRADALDMWEFGSGDPEDDGLILPLLRLRGGAPTSRQAKWIVYIRRACPTLGEGDRELELVWYLSRMLQRLDNMATDPDHRAPFLREVSRLLAYAPWEDEGERLAAGVRAGHVPFGTAFLGGYEHVASAMAPDQWTRKEDQ